MFYFLLYSRCRCLAHFTGFKPVTLLWGGCLLSLKRNHKKKENERNCMPGTPQSTQNCFVKMFPNGGKFHLENAFIYYYFYFLFLENHNTDTVFTQDAILPSGWFNVFFLRISQRTSTSAALGFTQVFMSVVNVCVCWGVGVGGFFDIKRTHLFMFAVLFSVTQPYLKTKFICVTP